MLQIECIEDNERFFELRAEWEDLTRRAAASSFFLSYAWVRSSWGQLRNRYELRIITVRDKKKLVAVMPLKKSRRFANGLPKGHLSFVAHSEFQPCDILLTDAELSADALRLALRFLLRERSSDWELFTLDSIPADSASFRLLCGLAQFLHLRYEAQPFRAAPGISLIGAWDQYFESRASRFRKTLRRVAERVERLGRVEITRYAGIEQGQKGLDKLVAISGFRQKEISGHAKGKRFLRDLLAEPEAPERLQFWILEAGGAPVAAEIHVQEGQKVYVVDREYDERRADAAPSLYLQSEILKRLFNEGYAEYHMAFMSPQYAAGWANQNGSSMSFRLYKQTLHGFLRHSLDSSLKSFRGLQALLPGGAK